MHLFFDFTVWPGTPWPKQGINLAIFGVKTVLKGPSHQTFIPPLKQQLFDLGGHLEFILSKKFIFLGVSLILAIFPWPWPRTKSWNLHMLSRLLYASIF